MGFRLGFQHHGDKAIVAGLGTTGRAPVAADDELFASGERPWGVVGNGIGEAEDWCGYGHDNALSQNSKNQPPHDDRWVLHPPRTLGTRCDS